VTAYKAIGTRPSHKVLTNLLVEAEGQNIKVTGFDIALGIEATFKGEVKTEGKVCLPGRLMNNIMEKLPTGEVSLWSESKQDKEAESLGERITCGIEYSVGKVELAGISAEEFPDLPEVEGQTIELSAETLVEGIQGTAFAASADESKQVLMGVRIEVDGKEVEFVATDGHRLALVRATNTTEPETKDTSENLEKKTVLVPAKTLLLVEQLVKNSLKSSGGDEERQTVRLSFEGGQLTFQFGNYKIITRNIEGGYPNIHELIPRQFQHSIGMERRTCLETMERLTILGESDKNIVKFNIQKNDEITASVAGSSIGSGEEIIPAEVSGRAIKIGFNMKYVIDALKSMTYSEDVVLNLTGEHSPAIITPVGGESERLVLLMPVQLTEER
jgi:DNA polymerase-3 subunit beta